MKNCQQPERIISKETSRSFYLLFFFFIKKRNLKASRIVLDNIIIINFIMSGPPVSSNLRTQMFLNKRIINKGVNK